MMGGKVLLSGLEFLAWLHRFFLFDLNCGYVLECFALVLVLLEVEEDLGVLIGLAWAALKCFWTRL